MIEINLLPEDLRRKELMQFKLPEWSKLKVYVIATLVFISLQILLTAFAFYQRLEILAVRGQITALKQENPALMAQKAETAAVKARLTQIESLTARKFYWASLLSTLSHTLTKGVWLRELSLRDAPADLAGSAEGGGSPPKGRQLRLLGSAVGAGQETAYIGKYVKGLQESGRMTEFFDQIEVTNIYQRKAGNYDVYDFELSCIFKKEVD